MADLNDRIGPPTPGQGLDARLGGAGQTLPELQAELEAAQGAERPSFLGEFLDAPTLIKLGLAAVGGLSGNKDLQALAAGFGASTLGQVGEDQQDKEIKRQKTIDDLISRVDTKQQQLISLMQSQPGEFVDAEGKPVAGATPEELARLTGLGIELSPAAMLNRAETTRNKEKVWAIQSVLFEQAIAAGNEGNAARSVANMFNSVDIPTTPEEASELLSIPADNVPSVLAQRADMSSVVDLMTWSEQNDKPWWDPEAPKLRPQIDVTGGMDTLMVDRADQGVVKILGTMDRLQRSDDPNDQAQWREYVNQPHTQIEILNNDPMLQRAVKKVYASDRVGEEIMLASLKYMGSAMNDPNTISALTDIVAARTPEGKQAGTSALFKSIYGQIGESQRTIARESEMRRIRTMTNEEFQEEFGKDIQAPRPPRAAAPETAPVTPTRQARQEPASRTKKLESDIQYLDTYNLLPQPDTKFARDLQAFEETGEVSIDLPTFLSRARQRHQSKRLELKETRSRVVEIRKELAAKEKRGQATAGSLLQSELDNLESRIVRLAEEIGEAE